MQSKYPMIRIGDLLDSVKKWSPVESQENKLFTYVDISSINRDTKQVDQASDIFTHEAPSRARQIVKAGDVLVSTVRPNLNAVAQLGNNLDDATASTGFCVLRPNREKVNARYLYYWVRTPYFVDEMTRKSTGATYPAVSDSIIKNSTLPLPPIEEQRRIAEILDQADGLRRKRQEAIRLTEELLRATFLDMFGDPVTNPKGWEVDRLGNIGILQRGKSKHRPRNDPSLLGGEYPLIQTGDVANCKGIIKKYSQTYSDKGLAQSRLWNAGTLCITIAANIAETGILGFDACFPDSIVGFSPSEKVTIEYIQGWFEFFQPILEANAPQSAQKNINLEILRKLEVTIPPIEKQHRFSTAIRKIRLHFNNQEKFQQSLDNLFNSLLQRAFRGEL